MLKVSSILKHYREWLFTSICVLNLLENYIVTEIYVVCNMLSEFLDFKIMFSFIHFHITTV